MDLSTDIGNLHKQLAQQNSANKEDSASMQDWGEILDLSGLDLDDEETWLYVPQHQEANSQNNINWPSQRSEVPFSQLPPGYSVPKLKSSKTIDTRTFTRPKKKYTRPSINDIEQLYNISGSDGKEMDSSTEERQSPRNKVPQTVQEEHEPPRPLQFDLSQPTSLHNFDSFMLNNADVDSFQNMSPPSLVNSLCSSTFANLMDSSFIKNDPVLREIRDKDFTETAMLQDIEAPMFQSITESCSSLNSDTPESFLKKVARDHTFRRNVSNRSDKNATVTYEDSRGSGGGEINATFEVQESSADSHHSDNRNITTTISLRGADESSSPNTNNSSSTTISHSSFGNNPNGTYRRTPKHSATFRKSDVKNNRLSLNLTYETTTNVLDREVSKSIENDMNNSNKGSSDDLNSARTKSSGKAVIMMEHGDSMEELKKRFSSSEGSVDLNRLSYCEEEEKEDQVNVTYKEDKSSSELNRTVEIKRSSLGSADSLDRMSSLSSSSKGSNKVLSMEDVQAIVEMQERSLSQVMSTPKLPLSRKKNLWDHNFISPIVANNDKDVLSDSELSDDYKSVKSQVSSKMSLDAWKKPSAKSVGYLAVVNKDVKLKTSQRTSYTIAGQKPLQALPNSIRGSYSSISTLKSTSAVLGGSQQSLYRPAGQVKRPPASTNLKTMGTKLKGSYTSLRPISATLPVVPPVGTTLNGGTHTITRQGNGSRSSMVNVTEAVRTGKMEMPPKVAPAQSSGDSTFVKPQILRTSGLPRPTGIPRPASRIPGPRSSNARPTSSFRSLNY